jgi:hypothetical protein
MTPPLVMARVIVVHPIKSLRIATLLMMVMVMVMMVWAEVVLVLVPVVAFVSQVYIALYMHTCFEL